jgi:hypothetical protein
VARSSSKALSASLAISTPCSRLRSWLHLVSDVLDDDVHHDVDEQAAGLRGRVPRVHLTRSISSTVIASPSPNVASNR